jgi:CRP/FNR family cyclic AMP-dependent transcriptional regulator
MAGTIANPFLVYRDGTGHEQLVALDANGARLTIGRGEATDVWLEWDREASRLHAALERYGSAWTVIDDGLSRNGTFVNGERVDGRRALHDGDVVRCGTTELVYQAPDADRPSQTFEPGSAPTQLRDALTTVVPIPDPYMVELLARTPPFSRLNRQELARVADVAVPRSYRTGEALFREGDLGDTCYVLAQGSVRVTRTHSDGRTIALAQLRPPALLGELAMFGSAPRSATVEAVEDTRVLGILASDMRRVLMTRPVIAMALLDELAARVRAADDQVSQRSFRNVPGRVAETLLAQVEGEDEAVITLTHAAIADMAGTSRETVSRFLAQLEKAGVVTCGRRQVTIHRPAALRNYIY